MKCSKLWIAAALLALSSALGVALAQPAATQPAATRPAMAPGQGMQMCMQQCQEMSAAMTETLKVIADAKASGKPEDLKAALDKAEVQLKAMQEKNQQCQTMMQQMQEARKQRMETRPGRGPAEGRGPAAR